MTVLDKIIRIKDSNNEIKGQNLIRSENLNLPEQRIIRNKNIKISLFKKRKRFKSFRIRINKISKRKFKIKTTKK